MEQFIAADQYDTLNRGYNTSQGRWLRPDPAGIGAANPANPQSWNRYAYVMNGPLSATDRLGLLSWCYDACHYLMAMARTAGFFADFEFFSVTDGTYYWDDGWHPYEVGLVGRIGFFSFNSNGVAANNSPQKPTASHCAGQALKANGLSVALDIVGAIPAVGNVTSAATRIGRAGLAIRGAVTNPAVGLASGGYGALTGLTDESPVGAISAGTGIGLAGADLALGGTEAIPVVGNVLSGLTGLYDIYQGVKTYQQCMAGGG